MEVVTVRSIGDLVQELSSIELRNIPDGKDHFLVGQGGVIKIDRTGGTARTGLFELPPRVVSREESHRRLRKLCAMVVLLCAGSKRYVARWST